MLSPLRKRGPTGDPSTCYSTEVEERTYFIYIMGNERPTVYIGVTNDLMRLVWEHKQDIVQGFTKKYRLHKLLYFESCDDAYEAITREKRLKHWRRAWKLELIRKANPEFKDLYPSLL